jgi:hypothetical protein
MGTSRGAAWLSQRPAPRARRSSRRRSSASACGTETEGGWQVHDYGDYQRTSSQVKETRRKDRERKTTTESDRTFPVDSERNPDGIQTESNGIPDGPSRATRANPALEEKREEKNPPTPLTTDCDEWLTHYEQTTGHQLPARTTKAFKAIVEAYGARTAEGHSPADLKLATVGAHADPHRRENGYDTADSILRPTKVGSLIAKGKLRAGSGANRRPRRRAADRFLQYQGPVA